ncbi:MAG: ABC transporter permease [Alphaproteobacteria bacterium]|nr:ABC transporter permease [Alphaproteobacteria bacterium]
MAEGTAKPLPPKRSEFERALPPLGAVGDVARPLSAFERLTSLASARRIFLLLLLAAAWQAYGAWLANPLVFPPFSAVLDALWDSILNRNLLWRAWTSIVVLAKGYVIGVVLALVITALAVSTRVGSDLLSTLTAMFNPLPAIALLPIALLWFGLGETSLVFVLVHSVLWPLALNTHAGFTAVSETLRMAGRNYGLSGVRYVVLILIPAAFPSILAGLKIAWAFAWRTLIAAELVFGVSSRSGGLGWFIFENRNELNIPEVFAGLVMVILIGLAMEGVVFRAIEARTVRLWGMQR